jgi:microcystin degradation protein MlrC
MAGLMKPRIFLAGLFHETNTFVDAPTPVEAFQITRGKDLFAFLGNDSPMDGFLQSAISFNWEVIPGIDYRAMPSGPLLDDVLEMYWNELRAALVTALDSGIDAIFLILHGAMATENYPDVEGELLSRIRALPGAETLPLFAVLDLHANVSERMARHASALIPYRENPHSDAKDTAIRATRLLRRALIEQKKPAIYILHSRILLAPPSTSTADAPMKPLQMMARSLEKMAGHWEIGVAPGFAHADTPDTGLTFWVVSMQPEISCHKTLETLYAEARSLVRNLSTSEWKISDALDQIAQQKKFPAILVEPADNIGGGAPGDATFILRALLERPLGRAGAIINDPATVEILNKFSPGEKAYISLGGKGSRLDLGPVELEVTLERLTDGRFELEDKQSHLASMSGSTIEMGPCAVVRKDSMTILITSIATPPFDLGQWTSQGIDPSKLEIIGVKAAVGHRRSYDPITRSTFTVQTSGPCSSDLRSLPYRKIRRPIFPLD